MNQIPNSTRMAAMSTHELVALFEQISLAEGDAIASFETAKANRLITGRRALLSELRWRTGDARRALFGLYSHRHPQVRLNVATSTFALDPASATSALRAIVASKLYPWAADAGLSISFLEDGTSQLPKDPE